MKNRSLIEPARWLISQSWSQSRFMSLQRALIRTGWPPLMDLGCACGDGCCFACNPTEAVTVAFD